MIIKYHHEGKWELAHKKVATYWVGMWSLKGYCMKKAERPTYQRLGQVKMKWHPCSNTPILWLIFWSRWKPKSWEERYLKANYWIDVQLWRTVGIPKQSKGMLSYHTIRNTNTNTNTKTRFKYKYDIIGMLIYCTGTSQLSSIWLCIGPKPRTF